MAKFLFYSDLHLRPERLADCELVLSEVGKLAKKHKAVIVNGGDTHNTRGVIRTSCFDRLYSHYKDWAGQGLRQIILVGNHDQEDRDGEIHPMRIFEQFDGWRVIDQPSKVDGIPNMMFFPHMRMAAIEKELKALDDKLSHKKWDAVVHWGIRGAMRNDKNKDSDGVPAEWLSNFRRVFSGHYHYRNTFENVHYIGSPFQQNFGEMGQNKGVLIYDQEKGEIEFCEIKGTPKHHEIKIHFEESGKERFEGDLKKISEKDYVQARVYGDVEKCTHVTQEDLRKRILCADLKIDRNVSEKAFSRLGISPTEIFDSKALAKRYVDFVSTTLDKKKLINIFESDFMQEKA